MYFYDTCALLDASSAIKFPIVISSITLQEIDSLKRSADKDKQMKAAEAAKMLTSNSGQMSIVTYNDAINAWVFDHIGFATNDVKICACALFYYKGDAMFAGYDGIPDDEDEVENEGVEEDDEEYSSISELPPLEYKGHDITFITSDVMCSFIASNLFGLPTTVCQSIEIPVEDACLGYKEVYATDDVLASLYVDMNKNWFECDTNEYVVLKNGDGEIVDRLMWNGNVYTHTAYKSIKSSNIGIVKPRNIQQELALDMLYNNNITVKVLSGKFGTGRIFAPLYGNV